MSIATKLGTAGGRWSALALIVTGQFMVVLDIAIVNVALPSIKADLGFSQTSLQWVISAYALLFGGTLLLGGRLADLFGRRRMFVAGLALFSASSLLCGLAWSAGSLIAFRAIQGLGGALLAPAALALLMTTYAEGRERNLALGIYGAASGSGAAVGVLLGGLLTSYLNWSWIFFINVPVGLTAIVLAPVLLRESRAALRPPPLRPRRRNLDHRRPHAPRLRDDTRNQRRLGIGQHGLAARRLGPADRGLRRDRASLPLAAVAPADLSAPHPHRRKCRDGDPRSRRLLRVLPADAVSPERPPLLGRPHRCRVCRASPCRSSSPRTSPSRSSDGSVSA